MAFQSSRRVAAIALACAIALPSQLAWAAGAIAIGQPSSVADGGVAVGYTWNYPSEGEAKADALSQCLSYKDAPDSTRALCKVVAVFDHQCVAIALDPNTGTEGFGWAVAPTIEQAASIALQKCRDVDGAEHADDCTVPAQKCDGV